MNRANSHVILNQQDHRPMGTQETGAFDVPTKKSDNGFSLFEFFIIVVILSALGVIVIPRFTNASDLAKASTIKDDLRMLRTQILSYRAQHQGVAPGFPSGDTSAEPLMDAFLEQMTLYTNAKGQTSAKALADFPLGPYLLKMPVNALNGSSEILFVDDKEPFPASANGKSGWIYQPSSGLIAVNVAGKDPDGRLYFDY